MLVHRNVLLHFWISALVALSLVPPGLLRAQASAVFERDGTAPESSNDDLPDAPEPQVFAAASVITLPHTSPPLTERDCPYDTTHAPLCRVHWRQLLISSGAFLAWQNAANLYSSYWYRYETAHGDWFARYAASVTGYKYSVWSDGNPLLDDYVGHPIMGSITNALWIQNDPRGASLTFSNTRPYWTSRLRALAFSTVYSTEWKLGPLGEAGFGHMGDHLQAESGHLRNETGFVSLVTTPVGGTLWTVAEDLLDQRVIARLEDRSRDPFLLVTYQFLNPARATGNLLRFRPPWYRDSRTVRANSVWSDTEQPAISSTVSPLRPHDRVSSTFQGGDLDDAPALPAERFSSSAPRPAAVATMSSAAPNPHVIRPAPPTTGAPGGTHELGVWWGLSLFSGPIWGYSKGVKYMPIDFRYSYRFVRHKNWALRYSPEITALAMLDWPTPNGTTPQTLRKRAYGSGLSPDGFQLDLRPYRRVQPFLSHNGGFIYFADRVLSSEGSRFMYTVDFGGGVNILRKNNQAITLGYRYQHLSNANISERNPGTDANTFYVGVSRFRSNR